jgi:hypothetical protein
MSSTTGLAETPIAERVIAATRVLSSERQGRTQTVLALLPPFAMMADFWPNLPTEVSIGKTLP